MAHVTEIDHPLVHHHLTTLRDAATAPAAFRAALERLTFLLVFEATRDLLLRETRVRTPLTETTGGCLSQRVGLVPILRAGLGMVDPVLTVLPDAEVWHLGFYRDERTLEPVEYYKKLPHTEAVDVALVVDPMLATGGSAVAALRAVEQWGVSHVKLLSVIAAPEGIEKVRAASSGTQVYVCAIDDHLNELGYIVPGLGDAGDRVFNAQAE